MSLKVTLVDGAQGGASITLTDLTLNFQGGAFVNLPTEISIAEGSAGNFSISGKQITTIPGINPIESQMSPFMVRTDEVEQQIINTTDELAKTALEAKLVLAKKFNTDIDKVIKAYNAGIASALSAILINNFKNENTSK